MHLLGLKKKMIALEKPHYSRVGSISTLREECKNRAQHSEEKRLRKGKRRLIMEEYNEVAILVSKECD